MSVAVLATKVTTGQVPKRSRPVNYNDIVTPDYPIDPWELLGENSFGQPREVPEHEVGTPIQEFYRGATVLITGGTGFMGKALTEKLLRSCPHLRRIYLLIRPKRGKPVQERLDAIFEDRVFRRLATEVPAFRDKISAVAGDISLPGLGLSGQDRERLIDSVTVVLHGAATVRFDEQIRTAVQINILGVRSMLELAKEMKHLKVNETLEGTYFTEVPAFRDKISAVAGDISLPGLGLSGQDRERLIDSVTVVLHGAATVRFDEQIRTAVQINILGVRSMLELAKEMKHLKSFVHVSTAYTHCPRKEIDERFYDVPYKYEEFIQNIMNQTDEKLEETTPKDRNLILDSTVSYSPPHTSSSLSRAEKKPTTRNCPSTPKSFVHVSTAYTHCPRKEIDERFYDVPYNYEEFIQNILDETDEKLEETTPKCSRIAPVHEWKVGIVSLIAHLMRVEIVNQRGESVEAIILGLRVYLMKDDIDTLPLARRKHEKLRMVHLTVKHTTFLITAWCLLVFLRLVLGAFSNLTLILACALVYVLAVLITTVFSHKKPKMAPKAAQKGVADQKSLNGAEGGNDHQSIPVYNFVSSSQKPTEWGHLASQGLHQAHKWPMLESIWYISYIPTKYRWLYSLLHFVLHVIPGLVLDTYLKATGRRPILGTIYSKLHKATETLAFFALRQWTWHDSNVQSLWGQLSPEDRSMFFFNVAELRWDDYTKAIICVLGYSLLAFPGWVRLIHQSIPVYNFVSSSQKPTEWGHLASQGLHQAHKWPMLESIWYISYIPTKYRWLYSLLHFVLHVIPGFVLDTYLKATGRQPM
ncbi:uncharacterized protein LOC113470475 [Diaphorina citri]|uniref:Fatty acyl-CoA reductase n=1 Tax=Diaphorina citri TaxID=121845 RepID=A0A3Q0J8F9_DIACI|nr:uncharacterized protein LOC113470475 [Diaphorina citri]